MQASSKSDHFGDAKPFFERLDSDDMVEIQQSKQKLAYLQERVKHLEDSNMNLEIKLEKNAISNISLENDLVEHEHNWKMKCELLSQEINRWKRELQGEKDNNDKMRENLSRTEKELYGILQRKYELMKGPSKGPQSATSSAANPTDPTQLKKDTTTQPEDMYQQIRAPKDATQRKMTSNLSQFLGIL